jgi:flagellar secretion chaperone FliS
MQGVMARAAQAYQQTQVSSQSPLELVVLLYDGALRFLQMASDGTRRNDMIAKHAGMSRSMAIIAELQNTLNMQDGGDVAKSLDSLYSYVTARLVDANLRRDPEPIDEVIRLLRPLREAWAQIAAPAAGQGPKVMR